jgi:hypothetical protein
VITLGAGIGIYIGASGVQETPATTSQPTALPLSQEPVTLNVGETLTITQNGVDVGTATISSVDATSQPADQYSKGPANGYFVTAQVKFHVRNDFTEGFYINPFDFYAVVRGQDYEYSNGNSNWVPSTFNYATLKAGETASGTLVFDVPARHGKIAYTPVISGGPIAFWKF